MEPLLLVDFKTLGIQEPEEPTDKLLHMNNNNNSNHNNNNQELVQLRHQESIKVVEVALVAMADWLVVVLNMDHQLVEVIFIKLELVVEV